jgi:hypothetical protein
VRQRLGTVVRAITIFDPALPAASHRSGTLPVDGSAEGYAVDPERGVFYTNLEDAGETLAIDVRTRSIRSRWRSGCEEPHGLALDRLVLAPAAEAGVHTKT